MPKMIQVRNVPDSLHRKLKSRAALEGMSLSDFVLKEMEHVAERPTMKELAARIASRTPVRYKLSPAEIIREERDRR
ncbi:MAG: FitA-like ribbon-helix-helix domain-containing protein [Bryobacteraceae bacterium]